MEITAEAFRHPHPGRGICTVRLFGRVLEAETTARALHAQIDAVGPWVAEMELYFSCLVRKRLRFLPLGETASTARRLARLTERLYLAFRPLVTPQCRLDPLNAEAPPLMTMPVKDAAAHWVRIDYRSGQWLGDFGYRPAHRR
jgi:hypothetical protein